MGQPETAQRPLERLTAPVGEGQPESSAPLRVLGLVEGDPYRALSGVAGHLFDALGREGAEVAAVNYAPSRAARLALAAATVRPSLPQWRARFHTSRLAHRALSVTLARRLARAPDFDVALQVHGWAAGQPDPYALYIDQTRVMAERGWPEWLPFARHERSALLARERAMYLRAGRVFAMGEPARDSLIEDYEVDPGRIDVVGGGLRFRRLPEIGDLPAAPALLFVGRDFERKGGECLLRAFELVRRRIPGATLDIVGTRAGTGRPGVTAHGKLGAAALADLYRRARAFCLPSLYEPWGLVLAEAMAHGVPCVGTSVQSIPQILDRGRAGLIVPPDDADQLAEALTRLLTDDQLATTLRQAGRERVEREFRWPVVAARMLSGLHQAAAPLGVNGRGTA